MASTEKNNTGKSKKSLKGYAKYSAIAFQMLAIILIGVFGGIKLDDYFELDSRIFTLILSVGSVILSMYFVIKDLLKNK